MEIQDAKEHFEEVMVFPVFEVLSLAHNSVLNQLIFFTDPVRCLMLGNVQSF